MFGTDSALLAEKKDTESDDISGQFEIFVLFTVICQQGRILTQKIHINVHFHSGADVYAGFKLRRNRIGPMLIDMACTLRTATILTIPNT
jgi:hypothetical protein